MTPGAGNCPKIKPNTDDNKSLRITGHPGAQITHAFLKYPTRITSGKLRILGCSQIFGIIVKTSKPSYWPNASTELINEFKTECQQLLQTQAVLSFPALFSSPCIPMGLKQVQCTLGKPLHGTKGPLRNVFTAGCGGNSKSVAIGSMIYKNVDL